jgi:hypothetical protein
MDSIITTGLEVFVVLSGRFAVWAFSFGRWRGESLDGEEGRIYGAAGAFSFVREGRRVVTHTGQLFAGIAFYGLFAGLALLYAVAL